ncbi:DUF423 domain-containing protein [Roseibium sp.]|uniref:DUF423 domain-containing protein n=1 Tax=Roseibium sp. TaxID=1936156 RepID=UPI003D149248
MTTQPDLSSKAPTANLLRICLFLAGLSGATGVACLALSAHSSASPLLETAAQVLLFHAPVYLGFGVLAQVRSVLLLRFALLLLTSGLCLFCGDLLLRSFANQRLFPMAAPTGGFLLILSWLSVALGALRVRPK